MSSSTEQVKHSFLTVESGEQLQTVTVIYYADTNLELQHDVKTFPKSEAGRVVLPDIYRKGKSIVAICEGKVNILNKIGERILPMEEMHLEAV